MDTSSRGPPQAVDVHQVYRQWKSRQEEIQGGKKKSTKLPSFPDSLTVVRRMSKTDKSLCVKVNVPQHDNLERRLLKTTSKLQECDEDDDVNCDDVDVSSELSDEVPCPMDNCGFKSLLSVSGSLAAHIHTSHSEDADMTHKPKEDLATALVLFDKNVALLSSKSEVEVASEIQTSPRCVYKTRWVHRMRNHIATAHVNEGLPCHSCTCTFGTKLHKSMHVIGTHSPSCSKAVALVNVSSSAVNINRRALTAPLKKMLTAREEGHDRPVTPKKSQERLLPSEKSQEGAMIPYEARTVTLNIRCPLCTQRFSSAYAFHRHMSTDHSSRNEGQGPSDVNTVQVSDLKQIQVVEEGGTLRCLRAGCSFTTVLPSTLDKHAHVCGTNIFVQKEEVKSGRKRVQCGRCKTAFPSEKELYSHFQTSHTKGGYEFRPRILPFKPKPVHSKNRVARIEVTKKRPKAWPFRTSTSTSSAVAVATTTSSRHFDSRLSRCSLCHTRMSSAWECSVHLHHAHVADGIPCPLCPCAFRGRVGLQNHLAMTHKKTSRKIFQCHRCSWKTTSSQAALNDHLKSAHVEGGEKCGECPCSYRYVVSLRSHYTYKHPGKQPSTQVANMSTNGGTECRHYGSRENGERKLKCVYCSDAFRSFDIFREHLIRAHPPSTSTSKSQKVEETSDDVVEIPVGENFDDVGTVSTKRREEWLKEFLRLTCSRCSTHFATSNIMSKHMQVCEEICDSFRCSLCADSFPSLLKLKQHIWSTHRPPTFVEAAPCGAEYYCFICRGEVRGRKEFVYHVSTLHVQSCVHCGFKCFTLATLDNHTKSTHS